MGFINNLFSSGAGSVVDAVGNTLDKLITTKGEKMQLELEGAKAEQQFKRDMANLSLEERKAVLGDMADARSREKAVADSANATKLGKNISSYLALMATLLCFSLFFVLLFGKQLGIALQDLQKDIVIYILGVLSALLTQVFSYYFGSSQGSAAKNEIISQMGKADRTTNLNP